MKFRSTIIGILTFYFLISAVDVFAQQSIVESNSYTDFKNAMALFNNKAYTSAQKEFEKIQLVNASTSAIYSESAYYEAICAIKLNQPRADQKVLDFVANNPTSSKKNKAYVNVGNYYFANRKPAYALKWYEKIDFNLLTKKDKNEINFKMAYGMLVAKNLSDAKAKFFPLMTDEKYGNDARYYYGFIAYKLEDYMLAKATFKDIVNNKTYNAKIAYYLLDINFKSGEFQKCIDAGKEIIGKTDKREASEVSKIVGESYFNLEKYQEAIPYLKAYRGKKGKWTNNDFYQVGYAYYKINDFKQAVSYFNKIIGLKDAVAQNAYYHLAECYLKLKLKNEALNAFKAASELSFNAQIQEDAALNYAKLSYEEGNAFEQVSAVLQAFLEKYPNSSSYQEINQLIVSSFVNQKDFQGALDYLKKKKTAENRSLINQISLYRGIQLFNENNFEKALSYFGNASEASEKKVRDSGKFWRAETLYRLENYAEALRLFLDFRKINGVRNLSEFKSLDYNIGYANFKLNNYTEAAKYFNRYTNQSNLDNSSLNDAYIRLGDCYYSLTQYKKAISFYEKAIENNGNRADYAQFQVGMSFGFFEDEYGKIDALNKIISDYEASILEDDALYQLGNTYSKVNDNENAHKKYDELLQSHPKSVFVPRVLLRQGLLYYNQNENDKALEKFKRTASQFSNTPDAIEAVRNAKNIYVDEDRLDEYVSWTKTLQFVDITESEIEKSSFSIAQKKYFENKNSSTIKSLEKYLADFAEYPSSLKVRYYLADTYYALDNMSLAAENYKSIIEVGPSEFREESLSKIAEIYLKADEFKEATPYLELLNQEAYETENILFAQSNLMNVYFETEQFNKAASLATNILNKGNINETLELDAQTVIARNALKNNDVETAQEYYLIIEEKAEGELKAEAMYHRAYFDYLDRRYADSNKVIQELIANYSAYKYWGVKSYLIMAKNYYQLKDAYQATFILENVIKNFNQFDDLIKEANMELDSIKRREAATNNSVNPKNNK